MSNELAAIIDKALCEVVGIFDTTDAENTELAEEVLKAGYRKPRTIFTAEQLDALPEGAIVVGDWAAFQKVLGAWVMVGGPSLARPELPVLHVWEPQP